MDNQPIQPNIPQEPQQPQPTLQPSIQPETPQKQSLPTWTIVLIVVGAIIVLAGASYGVYWYFTSQPTEPSPTDQGEIDPDQLPTGELDDETADWQTYRNEEYSFEVKYPEDWFLFEENNPYNEKFISFTDYKDFRNPDIEQVPEDILAYFIYIYPKADNTAFEKYQSIKSTKEEVSNDKLEYKLNGNRVINFYIVSERTLEKDNETWDRIIPYATAFLEDDNYGYYFYIAVPKTPELQKEEIEFLKKSIESFKFIEVDQTTNWQTYRNEEYGFEAKYPENFVVRESSVAACRGVSFWDKDFLSSRDTSVNKIVTFDVFITDSIEEVEKCIGGHYSLPAGPGAETYEFLNSGTVTINQNNFLKKNYKDIVPFEEYNAYNFSSWHINNKGATYTLIYNNNVTINPEPHKQLFNQILSTFKFID